MKNWKTIITLLVIIGVIITMLYFNKKKLSSANAGGIKEVFYVTVEKTSQKDLTANFSLTGTIIANNDVNILSETSGKVMQMFFKAGDFKAAGSILAQVDDELRKAAFMSAEANYDKAKKDFERFKNLFNQKAVTDAQLDAVKLGLSMAESQFIVAKRQLEDTKIKTPISGYVTMKNVDIGSTVQGAPQPTLIANIVDISRVKVKLNVSETYAFALKPGNTVDVTADVYPGIIFKGRIESVSAKSDEAHTFPVEIVVENKSAHQLKAGAFARVDFSTLKGVKRILIPRESLVGSIKDPQVYVVVDGTAKLRKLVLGSESNTFIQVLSGLAENETIVVSGQNNLVDNIKVEILNK